MMGKYDRTQKEPFVAHFFWMKIKFFFTLSFLLIFLIGCQSESPLISKFDEIIRENECKFSSEYKSDGAYINHANWNVLSWKGIKTDKNGLPMVKYEEKSEVYYNITTIAHYGLSQYSLFILNEQPIFKKMQSKLLILL